MTSSAFQRLDLKREGKVAVITFNHPPANAIDGQMVNELTRVFDELATDHGVRVIVINGGTGRFFSAGADIGFIQKSGPGMAGQLAAEGTELTNRMEALGKPIIAAVNGIALGGGNEFAMACDLRLAADTARFGLPEINLGLIPGWGGLQRMARLIGTGRTMQAALTGDMLHASDALAWGLVNKVVPAADLMKETLALAERLANQAPLAMAEIKGRIVSGEGEPRAEAVRGDVTSFARNLPRKDAKEGVAAFLEKRKPNFTGE